jgi:hypothetical protein
MKAREKGRKIWVARLAAVVITACLGADICTSAQGVPTKIAAGYGSIVGLKYDATVVAVGNNDHGQLDMSSWNLGPPSPADFNKDCDVDGTDLAALIANESLLDITTFAQDFGKEEEGCLDLGMACTIHPQCSSGFCVEGVCCNASCSGLCQSCLGIVTGGVDGICNFVIAGTDPYAECAPGRLCYFGICQ